MFGLFFDDDEVEFVLYFSDVFLLGLFVKKKKFIVIVIKIVLLMKKLIIVVFNRYMYIMLKNVF